MYEFLQYQVSDAMTVHPITIRATTKIHEVEALFESYDFNGVPVVDEHQHLLGIFTKFDLLKAFSFDTQTLVPRYDEIMGQSVAAFMSAQPVTTEPNLPLSRLLQKLVEMRTKSLPVVDAQGKLIGIIAREDVLKALRRAAIGHEVPVRSEA